LFQRSLFAAVYAILGAIITSHTRRNALVLFEATANYLCSQQGRTKRGLGLTPPLELNILQKIYYLRKEINFFAYFLLVSLST